MLTTTKFTLNDGRQIPALGFGTYDNSNCEDVVYEAIKVGYRHIDTAFIYKTEEAIGNAVRRAISEGLVTREELWITTKIWPTFHDRVSEGLDKSLKLLGMDYVDLLLIHWPVALEGDLENDYAFMPADEHGNTLYGNNDDWVSFYLKLEQEHKNGRAKSIGVSNVSAKYLPELLEKASIIPAINQFEVHPKLPQKKEIEANESRGISVTAFSPLGSSQGLFNLHENPVVLEIADKHQATTGSVLINWHIKQGRSVIPKTQTVERVAANAAFVNLDSEDLLRIDNIAAEFGLHRTVDFGPLGSRGDKLGYSDE